MKSGILLALPCSSDVLHVFQVLCDQMSLILLSIFSHYATFIQSLYSLVCTCLLHYGICILAGYIYLCSNSHYSGEPGLAGSPMFSSAICSGTKPLGISGSSFFTGQVSFLSSNQWCQSTEGT